jgi:hypothetical protein
MEAVTEREVFPLTNYCWQREGGGEVADTVEQREKYLTQFYYEDSGIKTLPRVRTLWEGRKGKGLFPEQIISCTKNSWQRLYIYGTPPFLQSKKHISIVPRDNGIQDQWVLLHNGGSYTYIRHKMDLVFTSFPFIKKSILFNKCKIHD